MVSEWVSYRGGDIIPIIVGIGIRVRKMNGLMVFGRGRFISKNFLCDAENDGNIQETVGWKNVDDTKRNEGVSDGLYIDNNDNEHPTLILIM